MLAYSVTPVDSALGGDTRIKEASLRTCIVLLNWNGWADTIECLETVFRGDYPCLPVIVCDNQSDDGSLEYIKAWAEGRLDVVLPSDNPLRNLSSPPIAKPIRYVEYDRATAEQGGDPVVADVPLVLIRTGANLGFAGGNNVALRYVLARGDRDCVWMLNNDTVIRPDSLRQLVHLMESDASVGIVGSTLLYYDAPGIVQTLGGATYNRWLALPRHICTLQIADRPVDGAEVAALMTYVAGASMLVSSAFLREVGLLSEDYFLYFEELDWALRAKGRYKLGYAPASIVFHKESGSIGGGTRNTQKSWTSDYHWIRNRILVTRKFFPASMPTVYLSLLGTVANRIRRKQTSRAWKLLRTLVALTLGERTTHGSNHTSEDLCERVL